MSGIKRDVSPRMLEQQKQLTQVSDKLHNVERQLVVMQNGGSLGFYVDFYEFEQQMKSDSEALKKTVRIKTRLSFYYTHSFSLTHARFSSC